MSRPLVTDRVKQPNKNPNLAHLSKHKKYYVCGPCLKAGTPFMVPTDEDGMKEFEDHMQSHEVSTGKADK